MSNRDRIIDFIFMIVLFAGGLVLLSLFFQALAWTPFLLSSVTWNS